MAMLGLTGMEAGGELDEGRLGATWDAACVRALAAARGLARKYSAHPKADRVGTGAVRFVAQALCLYEKASIEKVIGSKSVPALDTHSARAKAIKALKKGAVRNHRAEELGLVDAAPTQRGSTSKRRGLSLRSICWPASELARLGFVERARTLAVCMALLFGYAVISLALHRMSGWIYLSVAALVHIEAVFSLGDFHFVAEYFKMSAETSEESP